MIKARVRPITILAKAAACRVHYSARMAAFVVEGVAMATAAMAKAASNTSKATEVKHKVPEHPSNLTHACPAESLTIRPRSAKQSLLRVPLPSCQNKSC
jgi:ribosomal protein L24